jgi:ankyrin repeat protein
MGHLAMNAHPPNKTAERDAKEKTPSEDTELMQQITIDTQVAALIEAVTQGNFSRVKAQLDAGASVNAKNEEGRTLLMQSISSGHRSLALTLIVLGADLTEQDERGRTALMYAVEADDKVFISRLRQLSQIAFKQDAEERKSELRAFSGVERSLLDGRDFDLRNIGMSDLERQADENGETASLIAAREGDWKLLSQVASTVDSLKAQDNRGRTLPMHAAIHGRLDWFERLASPTYLGIAGKSNVFVGEMLAFDVDQLALADSDGKTAVQLADEHGHTEIADILRRHLQAIVDNQTAEIEKGGDDVSQHRELRRQAWQALGDPEKSQQDSDKSMEEID